MSLLTHHFCYIKYICCLRGEKKGEREIDFRLKQSTISYVQGAIWLNLAWGAGLDG